MDEPGSATITATLRAGDETVTASVLVVVGDDGAVPQVAYDLSGAVRDVSNTAMTNVELTLSDDRGGNRIAITGQNGGPSEGTFRFAPVPQRSVSPAGHEVRVSTGRTGRERARHIAPDAGDVVRAALNNQARRER